MDSSIPGGMLVSHHVITVSAARSRPTGVKVREVRHYVMEITLIIDPFQYDPPLPTYPVHLSFELRPVSSLLHIYAP